MRRRTCRSAGRSTGRAADPPGKCYDERKPDARIEGGGAHHFDMGTVRNSGASLNFSRRYAILWASRSSPARRCASRSSPARRCAREDCEVKSSPKRTRTRLTSFPSTPFFRFSAMALRYEHAKRPEEARVSDGSNERAQDARRSPERISRANTPSGEGAPARYDDSSDGYVRARRVQPAPSSWLRAKRFSSSATARAAGLVRHLLVAARAGRSAQRAHATQRARLACAAPRVCHSSAPLRRVKRARRHRKPRA